MAEKEKSPRTLVIGLGRFGSAIITTFNSLEREILGVESDFALARRFSLISPMAEVDASQLDVMEQFDARGFSAAMVRVDALGASAPITANLTDTGMEQIWVEAVSREQGEILCRVRAYHVIYPESDVGRHTAHLTDGRTLDYVEMDREGFSIVKTRPPTEI